MKLHSFVSEEKYVYFASKVEVVRQEEKVEISYQMCNPYVVLTYNTTGKWDFFIHDRIWKEKEALYERIDALVIYWDQFIDELIKSGNILREITDKVRSLGYYYLLVMKVYLLAKGIRERDSTLSLI